MASEKSKDHVRTPKSSRAHVTMPGGQSPKELVDKLTELEQQYGAEFVNLVGQWRGKADGLGQPMPTSDADYPVRLYAPDKYDSAVEMKRDLIGQSRGDKTPFGQAVLTTQDMDWLARKRDQLTAAQFKQFVSGMYNKNDPAQAALLHKVYPELLQEQKQILDDRIDLVRRLAMMKLYGQPRDKEDLRLLFALSSGAVSPPVGNLWDPSSWTDNYSGSVNAIGGNMIKRGFFSATKMYAAGKTNRGKIPFDQLGSLLQGGTSATPREFEPAPLMGIMGV